MGNWPLEVCFEILPVTQPGDKPICFCSIPWTRISSLFSFRPLLCICPLFCFLSSILRYSELDQMTWAFFTGSNVRDEGPWLQATATYFFFFILFCEWETAQGSHNKTHMLGKGCWQTNANSEQKKRGSTVLECHSYCKCTKSLCWDKEASEWEQQ